MRLTLSVSALPGTSHGIRHGPLAVLEAHDCHQRSRSGQLPTRRRRRTAFHPISVAAPWTSALERVLVLRISSTPPSSSVEVLLETG